MKIVDVNILLYAISKRTIHHAVVVRWWEAALSGEEPMGLPWNVLLGFLRVSTSPRAFDSPLDVSDAVDMVELWLQHPNVRVITESGDHWPVFRELLREVGTAGNLTSDAHLAALAITHGASLVSCDTDFSRFPKLRWINPLARPKC